MPAVTIIITTFNLEKYIARCLDDLLKQTMRDFEILIIDDHSTDATAMIIQNYLTLYPERIQAMFLSENLGSSSRTRNAALNSGMICGEYAVFLDGDDRIEPNYLECLYSAVKIHNADMAVCSYDRINAENGRKICDELQWLPDGGALASGDPTLAFLNGAIWNKIIRLMKIGDERITDLKIGEDAAFALKLYSRCNRIACVRRNLIHYQVHPGSVITGTDTESIKQFADELAKQYRYAPEKTRQVFALAAYLHIALSMMMRAADHKDIDLAAQYRWTRDYCRVMFDDFNDIKPYMFHKYSGQMFKGIALFLSFLCYKHGLLLPAAKALQLYTRITGKDIKW
jgi:glycosyltransferase involved in cell wall biosynthesis